MARGRKKTPHTASEKIQLIEAEIQELENRLIQKRTELEDAQEELAEEEKNHIYELIKTSNKSLEEITEFLKGE